MTILWEVGKSLGVDGSGWAAGCDECQYGLVWAGEQAAVPRSSLSLERIRTIQAERGELTYCNCRAGQAQRQHYLGNRAEPNRVWQERQEQAG